MKTPFVSPPVESKATRHAAVVLVIFALMTIWAAVIDSDVQGYEGLHLALVVVSLIFVSVFLVRVRHFGLRYVPRSIHDWQQWQLYARTGALGPDALVVAAIVVCATVVDFRAVAGYPIRIGAVSAVVLVQILTLLVRGRRGVGRHLDVDKVDDPRPHR